MVTRPWPTDVALQARSEELPTSDKRNPAEIDVNNKCGFANRLQTPTDNVLDRLFFTRRHTRNEFVRGTSYGREFAFPLAAYLQDNGLPRGVL